MIFGGNLTEWNTSPISEKTNFSKLGDRLKFNYWTIQIKLSAVHTFFVFDFGEFSSRVIELELWRDYFSNGQPRIPTEMYPPANLFAKPSKKTFQMGLCRFYLQEVVTDMAVVVDMDTQLQWKSSRSSMVVQVRPKCIFQMKLYTSTSNGCVQSSRQVSNYYIISW